MDPNYLLRATNLHKTYQRHAQSVEVLRGLDIDVYPGEFLSIIGASGSGKSTLLHLLGTLDQPDSGKIYLEDRRIDTLPRQQRDKLRNSTFGFIFQFYHLLPELNTLENVLAPEMIGHSIFGWFYNRRTLKKRATELLDRVGLGHRLKHKPKELSGGELQRAAIARALIRRPRILLADEPTGNLDEETGGQIMALLRDLHAHDGLTVVMVTHNLEMASQTNRVVKLVTGQIEPSTEKRLVPVSSVQLQTVGSVETTDWM
ncbi:MAG: ABC transporter ATP-binding protein [Gemmataceae bacterium]